jgi:ATP-dependent Lon protease
MSEDQDLPVSSTTPDVLTLPVLPLRDIIVFPHMIVPLFVGREKSVRALESVMRTDKKIVLVTQKDATLDNPGVKDLYRFGTIGTVLQLLKLPDGTVKVLIEGGERIKVENFHDTEFFFEATVEMQHEPVIEDIREVEALSRAVLAQFDQYIKLSKKVATDVLTSISQIEQLSKLSDSMAAHIPMKIPQKQELLEILPVRGRLENIYNFLESEIDVMEVEKKIRKRVKSQMEKSQRDYYLNEQIKAIQKELGEGEEGLNEVKELEDKLKKANLPKDAKEKVTTELKKLKMMSPMSAESTVVRNYLDWVLGVPWNKRTRTQKDLKKAQEVLDEDHYGLEKVKDRIVEYIAVQQRTVKVKGSILCLVGPPGVGKTSLGKSIAKATGRKFVRVALGGVHDESEIRGHRRTYIGAMPGKIIQGMKKAGTSNPVFLLDEIDKLGSDFRGDPSAALLEVLDPEQNVAFNDHYLELDYDLSDVMFVCTANSLNIPRPLMDRMEILRLAGYTEDEKVEIATSHLISKQIEENGLKPGEVTIEEAALRDVIRFYTRESGVRNLEREIGKLCRKSVKQILLKQEKNITITPENLSDYLGVRKFRFDAIEKEALIGIVNGLAWTEVGGELLPIESVTIPGEGKVSATGSLKDVMKESITAAEMLIKSRAKDFGINPKIFKEKNVHVHVPDGATPKDGPSAGIAMVTSIVSVLTGIPVRNDIAMTGEITLRGRVFPIGGLKEKLLAALRGGVKKVLIPIENEKDLVEIPANVKSALEIIPVETIDQVLEHALERRLVPFVDDMAAESETPHKPSADAGQERIHH